MSELYFQHINLASGARGDEEHQGMKRDTDYYKAGSRFALGVRTNDQLDENYYVVYNQWPTFADAGGNSHASGTLDCVIVRKSDRKAVHLKITGSNKSHYEGINKSNGSTTIKAVTHYWTPAFARLRNLGYI